MLHLLGVAIGHPHLDTGQGREPVATGISTGASLPFLLVSVLYSLYLYNPNALYY